MCKTLIILILLFDGTLTTQTIELKNSVSVNDSSYYAKAHREIISKHYWHKNGDYTKHGWYLNNDTGTYQGFICSN
jgi:hypothetical protein